MALSRAERIAIRAIGEGRPSEATLTELSDALLRADPEERAAVMAGLRAIRPDPESRALVDALELILAIYDAEMAKARGVRGDGMMGSRLAHSSEEATTDAETP